MMRGYEVRVEGVLGDSFLRNLDWSHRVIPEETVVRVVATQSELNRLIQACIESGLAVERVSRVREVPVAETEHHDVTRQS